jgi:hypothetical protein
MQWKNSGRRVIGQTDFELSGTFAILAVLTQECDVFFRPIGGDWGFDIIEAIQEADEMFPNCRYRLFEHRYDDWRRYFDGVVARDRLL